MPVWYEMRRIVAKYCRRVWCHVPFTCSESLARADSDLLPVATDLHEVAVCVCGHQRSDGVFSNCIGCAQVLCIWFCRTGNDASDVAGQSYGRSLTSLLFRRYIDLCWNDLNGLVPASLSDRTFSYVVFQLPVISALRLQYFKFCLVCQ